MGWYFESKGVAWCNGSLAWHMSRLLASGYQLPSLHFISSQILIELAPRMQKTIGLVQNSIPFMISKYRRGKIKTRTLYIQPGLSYFQKPLSNLIPQPYNLALFERDYFVSDEEARWSKKTSYTASVFQPPNQEPSIEKTNPQIREFGK